MKTRVVGFSSEAIADLNTLHDWIAEKAGAQVALSYIERLERFCRKLDIGSERGHTRNDIVQGLRIIGFERRVTIAFTVDEEQVIILNVFYGGQNWEEILSP